MEHVRENEEEDVQKNDSPVQLNNQGRPFSFNLLLRKNKQLLERISNCLSDRKNARSDQLQEAASRIMDDICRSQNPAYQLQLLCEPKPKT